jgi:hypothetical protein
MTPAATVAVAAQLNIVAVSSVRSLWTILLGLVSGGPSVLIRTFVSADPIFASTTLEAARCGGKACARPLASAPKGAMRPDRVFHISMGRARAAALRSGAPGKLGDQRPVG